MRNILRAVALLVVLLGTSAVGAYVSALVPQAHASVRVDDAAACIAVWEYHHVNAVYYDHQHAWEHSWHHAWHMSRLADPALRVDIRNYLAYDTGHDWSLVNYDCGFTQN